MNAGMAATWSMNPALLLADVEGRSDKRCCRGNRGKARGGRVERGCAAVSVCAASLVAQTSPRHLRHPDPLHAHHGPTNSKDEREVARVLRGDSGRHCLMRRPSRQVHQRYCGLLMPELCGDRVLPDSTVWHRRAACPRVGASKGRVAQLRCVDRLQGKNASAPLVGPLLGHKSGRGERSAHC